MEPTQIQLTPDVIQALNEELAYQESMAGSIRADTIDHGFEGQMITLSRYVRKMENAWTDNAGNASAQDMMRKCAGIAYRALVKYGCPKRK